MASEQIRLKKAIDLCFISDLIQPWALVLEPGIDSRRNLFQQRHGVSLPRISDHSGLDIQGGNPTSCEIGRTNVGSLVTVRKP